MKTIPLIKSGSQRVVGISSLISDASLVSESSKSSLIMPQKQPSKYLKA